MAPDHREAAPVYPPEPWDLRGQMYLSVFAVPRRDLRPLPRPLTAAVRPVPFGARLLVGAAWVRYEPGGTLHYRELLSAVLVHEGLHPRVSITDIWVDSAASRDGGRALWGIPKDLAHIELRPAADGATAAVAALHPGPAGVSDGTTPDRDRPDRDRPDRDRPDRDGQGPDPDGTGSDRLSWDRAVAAATVTRGVRVPGRWPAALSVAQVLDGRVRRTGVRGHARVRISGATWQVDPQGPLGYLAGRRPLVTVTVADFRLRFGAAASAPDRRRPEEPRALG